MKKATIIGSFLVVYFCFASCSFKQNSNAGGADAVSTSNSDVDKYNAYVDFQNFIGNRFSDAVEDYENKFGVENTINIEDNFSFMPFSLDTFYTNSLKTAYEYVSKSPSYGKVDDDIKALYQPGMDFFAIWKEIYDYYSQKNYVDDNFAKGKELHPQFIASLNKFDSLYDSFYNDMRQVIDKQAAKDLQFFKDKKQMIRYSALNSLLKMKKMMNEIRGQGISGRNLTELDMSKFKPFYDDFVDSFNDLNKYTNDEKQMNSEGFSSDISFKLLFLSAMTDVKTAASELIDRVNKQKPVDQISLTHFADTVEGTPEKLESKISVAVDRYNDFVAK